MRVYVAPMVLRQRSRTHSRRPTVGPGAYTGVVRRAVVREVRCACFMMAPDSMGTDRQKSIPNGENVDLPPTPDRTTAVARATLRGRPLGAHSGIVPSSTEHTRSSPSPGRRVGLSGRGGQEGNLRVGATGRDGKSRDKKINFRLRNAGVILNPLCYPRVARDSAALS